jgi:hypothetical protein
MTSGPDCDAPLRRRVTSRQLEGTDYWNPVSSRPRVVDAEPLAGCVYQRSAAVATVAVSVIDTPSFRLLVISRGSRLC